MYVRNWMLPQQYTVTSDTLVIEAAMKIRERNLKMIPVVDDGHLRGVVHRRDVSDAAMCVSGTGDVCEMNYFCNKLKVKDVMVRMPVTVSVDDTFEDTLIKGKEMWLSTFPVVDGDNVVGVVSDREIFVTLYKLLEAGQKRFRITLSGVALEPGTLSEILGIVDANNGVARAIFTVEEDDEVRVVLRAETNQPDAIRQAFEEKGYNILEFTS